MRTILAICAVALLALQANAGVISKKIVKRSTANEVIEACEKKSSLTSEESDKYFAEDFLPEDNEGLTALLGCIGEGTGIIDSKGVVDYAKIGDLIVSMTKDNDTDEVTEILMKFGLFSATRTCKDSATSLATSGQTVTRAFNCVKKESKAIAQNIDKIYNNMQACVGLNELSKDDINKRYKAGYFPDDEADNDDNLIVVFSCLGKVLGLVDSNKVVRYEDIKDFLAVVVAGEDSRLVTLAAHIALDEVVNSCKSEPVHGETTEEILLHTFNCIFEKMRSEKA